MSLRDEIGKAPWADVSHAYGPANDTPHHLLALLSDDPEEYDHALYALWGTICHQGSVYEASCAAIPILISILHQLPDERKPGLLYLLAGLTHRDQYAERDLSYLVIERTHDPDYQHMRKRQIWTSGAQFLQEGNQFHDHRWMALAHEQVARGLSEYFTLLGSDDRATVLASLHLLAAFRERSDTITQAITTLLSQQPTDVFVEAEALLTLGAVLPADSPLWEGHIGRLMADSSEAVTHPLVRYTAAVALAKHCPGRLPTTGLDTLINASVTPKHLNELREALPSLEGRVSVHVEACQVICLLGSPTAVNTLVTILDHGAERWCLLDTMRVAEALLDTAFFGGWVQNRSWYASRRADGSESAANSVLPHWYHWYNGILNGSDEFDIRCYGVEEEADRLCRQFPRTGLSDDQRQAVRSILVCEPFWRYPHNLLDMYGLPRTRDGLESLLDTE